MTEYKKLAYQCEDTFILGKSLPIVALRQLPKIADKFLALPDVPDYLPGTQRAIASGIMDFYDTNKPYADDERQLRESFIDSCKQHRHSHYTLNLFKNRVKS